MYHLCVGTMPTDVDDDEEDKADLLNSSLSSLNALDRASCSSKNLILFSSDASC